VEQKSIEESGKSLLQKMIDLQSEAFSIAEEEGPYVALVAMSFSLVALTLNYVSNEDRAGFLSEFIQRYEEALSQADDELPHLEGGLQ
jgi:hypothetical protein